MRKLISMLGILLFSIGLVGCNTMQGFGKDVEHGGEKIQGEAQKNK